MRCRISQKVSDVKQFKSKVLSWANEHFQTICYLDSNDYVGYQYPTHDCLIGIGEINSISCTTGDAFERLKSFHSHNKDWLFGFLGYDLKNEVEQLTSNNWDGIGLPDMFFFQPEHVIEVKGNEVIIHAGNNLQPAELFNSIFTNDLTATINQPEAINLRSKFSRLTYLETVEKIKYHIAKGDVYELNLCMEFYTKEVRANPLEIFKTLNELSRAPFSSFLKSGDKYLLCASPERFLKKSGNKLISQPMKGTIHRGDIFSNDEILKKLLQSDPKEKAENMMIVDLVRNDLSRSCKPGTVKVEELFEVKTFEQVHQLVSTISGELKNNFHFIDAIKNAFPMGSMTGAPKIKAMELIEEYEQTKRGLYSGAVGYITPENDFDFNVVIRSMLYNGNEQYLSYQVGSAITHNSSPEKEYKECLLKATGMKKTLEGLNVPPILTAIPQ